MQALRICVRVHVCETENSDSELSFARHYASASISSRAFAAKGSPVIKFIDFGGACTWTPDEGLTGLVGTPQYVAPEVVTGYGEDKPTDAPYGKGCGAPERGLGSRG